MQRGALQLLSTTPRRLRLDERHAAQLAHRVATNPGGRGIASEPRRRPFWSSCPSFTGRSGQSHRSSATGVCAMLEPLPCPAHLHVLTVWCATCAQDALRRHRRRRLRRRLHPRLHPRRCRLRHCRRRRRPGEATGAITAGLVRAADGNAAEGGGANDDAIGGPVGCTAPVDVRRRLDPPRRTRWRHRSSWGAAPVPGRPVVTCRHRRGRARQLERSSGTAVEGTLLLSERERRSRRRRAHGHTPPKAHASRRSRARALGTYILDSLCADHGRATDVRVEVICYMYLHMYMYVPLCNPI
jgi:hypothetical protein